MPKGTLYSLLRPIIGPGAPGQGCQFNDKKTETPRAELKVPLTFQILTLDTML